MPRRDGTGPDGQGPKTGGQRGNCPGAKPVRPLRNGGGQRRRNRRRGANQ